MLDDTTLAHIKGAFEWIFPGPNSISRTLGYGNLSWWLGVDAGYCWIRGKSGSGKSALMKLVRRHRGIRYVLKALAGDQALGVALEISGRLLLYCKRLKWLSFGLFSKTPLQCDSEGCCNRACRLWQLAQGPCISDAEFPHNQIEASPLARITRKTIIG